MVIVKYIDQLFFPPGFNGKTYDNCSIIFHKNNTPHRYYGPAVFYINFAKSKRYSFNNKNFGFVSETYSQSDFIKDINKLWLL